MMGFSSLIKSPSPPQNDKQLDDAPADDTEVLDEEPRNILIALLSQVRIGMDLSKVTLPTFVLEPRSMLERVTDFHAHPELLHGAGDLDSPEDRYLALLRYYLAGWHIKPKGVKKPYNPVLGEFFRCRYDYPDGSVAFYVAEQVSHHPPISAWYFSSPEHNVDICGELRPKSKFLGNSAATIMDGSSHARYLNRPQDGEYLITMPNMYARGILFGKMVMELGDISEVRNDKTGYSCDVEFKTKGFFSGTYNTIAGKVKGPKGDVGEVSGKWSDEMDLTRKGKGKEVFFDAHNTQSTAKVVAPESDQELKESRRLWSKVTAAIKAKDLDAATEAKSAIEDQQREEARLREEKGETFAPRFFKLDPKGEYRPAFTLEGSNAKEQVAALRAFVYGNSPEPPHTCGTLPEPPL